VYTGITPHIPSTSDEDMKSHAIPLIIIMNIAIYQDIVVWRRPADKFAGTTLREMSVRCGTRFVCVFVYVCAFVCIYGCMCWFVSS
jgi:hypothetical protein